MSKLLDALDRAEQLLIDKTEPLTIEEVHSIHRMCEYIKGKPYTTKS
jgi:hypothetical protein